MNRTLFFLLALRASLLSTGGMGNVPLLHDDLIARGWASPRHFAEALAVGQISPGPNGLWAVSLGFLLGGWVGALLSLAAICLPPLLVLAVDRLYRRVEDHPAVAGSLHGLGLAVTGVFFVVLWRLLGAYPIDARSLGIATASLALAATRRVPTVAIIALAGIAGALLP